MKKATLIPIVLLLLIGLVLSISITEDPSNPADATTTSNSSLLFSYNISAPGGLNNITWSWDNNNYTLYDDSLVLFMNFDNRSSLGENDTHVKDLSKYGNNGTVVGGAVFNATGGKYNGAFEFDGVNDYVNVVNTESLNSTMGGDELTISFWIKSGKNIVDYNEVIEKSRTIRIELFSDRGIFTRLYNSTSSSTISNDNSFTLNEWFFYSLTYNSSTGNFTVYVNAISKGNTYLGGDINYTDSDLRIMNGLLQLKPLEVAVEL